jgi:hypothetical protein
LEQQLQQREDINENLRKQLKDVKGLNLQMLSTMQVGSNSLHLAIFCQDSSSDFPI